MRVSMRVTTDIADGGFDIDDVTVFINFDLPRTADIYLHRIGRTGRAGKKGTALSLVEAHDNELLIKIGRYLNEPLKIRTIEDLRPKTRAPSATGPKKPSKKQLEKRKQKKNEEAQKPRVKVRHRDSKNIGKRRKPAASSAGLASGTTEESAE